MNDLLDLKNTKVIYIVFVLCACIFFLGKINFFNMCFALLGIGSIRTILSTVLVVGIDCIIGLYFLLKLIKDKALIPFIVFVVFNVIYIAAHIINFDIYTLAQYIVFVVPFAMVAYIVSEEAGSEKLFKAFEMIMPIAVIMGIIYIVFLFTSDMHGIASIQDYSYGDVAYALLPFCIISVITFIQKRSIFMVCSYIALSFAIIYTGTRSAILCIAFAIFCTFVVLLFDDRCKKNKIFSSTIICVFILVIVYVFCINVVPSSSRLSIITDDFIKESNENIGATVNVNIGKPKDGDETIQSISSVVWSVKEQKYDTIEKVYIDYIVSMETDKKTTEEVLKNDIKKGTEKYIIVSSEQKDWASDYTVHMNRVNLWKTALMEFKQAPFIGNGPLHYQTKYNGTFPHNIILEAMSDFGIAGAVVLVGGIVYLAISNIIICYRKKAYSNIKIVIFIISFVPFYLLYTSLFLNGLLLFSVLSLIYINCNMKKNINSVFMTIK